MDYAACGKMGREDGKKQVGSRHDHMKHKREFLSMKHWDAYLTGFYRAAGHQGNYNRSAHKALDHKVYV